MLAGFHASQVGSGADFVTIMDADMQDSPSLLPEMLEILETENYEYSCLRKLQFR